MVDDTFKAEVDAYVDEVWEDVVRSIDALVCIESVADETKVQPGAPWGSGSAQALSCALSIAEQLGLEAHNCEGYIGYADLQGVDDQQIATIAHADIVPIGDGWSCDPLRVTRKQGYLIGRGVLDDKGPLVLSLYAAHFFARRLSQGIPLPHSLRCIVGACEETTMSDVDYYLAHHEPPAFLFTPDADFPLICGEKGVFHGSFTSVPIVDGSIVEFSGGLVVNAVPGSAVAVVDVDVTTLPEFDGISIEDAGDGYARITAHGKGGHASLPEGTVNAIGLLARYLLDVGVGNDDERAFLELQRRICVSSDGAALDIATSDERFGVLTCIGGTLRQDAGCLVQTIDIRYPASIHADALVAALERVGLRYGCTFTLLGDKEPYYADPSSPEVRCLLATYQEYTGNESAPIVIGGGTYARLFPRACAFGPNDPSYSAPAWVGPEHGADEGVSEEALRRALKIYIVAIARLMELDKIGV